MVRTESAGPYRPAPNQKLIHLLSYLRILECQRSMLRYHKCDSMLLPYAAPCYKKCHESNLYLSNVVLSSIHPPFKQRLSFVKREGRLGSRYGLVSSL